MVATIFEFLMGLIKAIPIFNKWFTKTPEQKVEEKKSDLRDEIDQFKETGRPPS
jgi:hypothetical protein